MLVRTFASAVTGIDAVTVTIEVNVSRGIRFFLVGLPDSAVKESQQRIESALRSMGLHWPGKQVVINMAPADIRKEGSSYDLPLAMGILDYFANDKELRDIPLIGPGKSGARLEASKDFAKAFLTRHNIPTAVYKSFDRKNVNEAPAFLRTLIPPYVIKADGLAAGKGVVILDDILEAELEVESMLSGKFGLAGQRVVIEQFLKGIELSVFIITDGTSYKLLPEAKDYKRIGRVIQVLTPAGWELFHQ